MIKTGFNKLETLLAKVGGSLQCLVLLVLRLYWGWQFAQTGWGKLTHLDRTAGYFASLEIPWPKLNAALAGGTEALGGVLLMLGLAARVITVPLMFVMAMAYVTADQASVRAIFSDPDKFVTATPFLFLLTVVIIFVFGPGRLSLDALFQRRGVAK